MIATIAMQSLTDDKSHFVEKIFRLNFFATSNFLKYEIFAERPKKV